MKLSDAMIERAAESLCNSIGPEFDAWPWDRTEGGVHHRVQWRIDARAALEAALSECCIETVEATEGPYGEYGVILTEPELIDKRIVLVAIED
ncbi:MAG: hypothetical protein ACYDBH_01425 [Acidobacteriaceae bacterium]